MFNNLNTNIFNSINYFAGKDPLLDKFAVPSAQYMPFIFIILLAYLWFFRKEYRKFILYSGYSVVAGLLANFLITLFYFHNRPFMDNLGTLLIKHTSDSSFPSDHTTFMLSIAFTLLYFNKTRKLGIILSILGIIGGISRIYCGVHYPFDILGSVIVAAVASFVIFSLKKRFQKINSMLIAFYTKVASMVTILFGLFTS